jgi:ketosteroid isomerase-like protein
MRSSRRWGEYLMRLSKIQMICAAVFYASAVVTVFTTTQVVAGDKATTEKVLTHHLTTFGAGDLEGVLSDYTEDSVVIIPNGVLRGKEAIKGLFTALIAEFGKPGTKFNMRQQTVEGDVAYIVWDAETPDNVYVFATDTLVVNNGKIKYQTVAFKVAPK